MGVTGRPRRLALLAPVLVVLPVLATLLLDEAPAVAAPGPARAEVTARTDQLIFITALDEFQRQRAAAGPVDGLDWSSDGCSVPVLQEPQRSVPQGFDFRAACERHDFGYRNLKAQARFTEDVRRRIDDGFRADMDAVCAQQSGWLGFRAVYCRHIAEDYHFWVRSCGATPAPYCPLEARKFVDRYVDR